MNTYVLDTSICSFIMRQMPAAVLQRLSAVRAQKHRIVISVITHAEMRYGQIGPKALARHRTLVDAFVLRLDAILPWDRHAVDAATEVKRALVQAGTSMGPNDTAIAGHAMATASILVTNNTREFSRVAGLIHEDWV